MLYLRSLCFFGVVLLLLFYDVIFCGTDLCCCCLVFPQKSFHPHEVVELVWMKLVQRHYVIKSSAVKSLKSNIEPNCKITRDKVESNLLGVLQNTGSSGIMLSNFYKTSFFLDKRKKKLKQ